jgi:hypothetical protein
MERFKRKEEEVKQMEQVVVSDMIKKRVEDERKKK